MLVNGKLRDSGFQRKTGYVQQQDLHLSTATVREALTFSALLRQPPSTPKQEKLDYVEEVIDLLEMREYIDAVIGEIGEGLNVEQRKRLTIGVELAAKPQLLLFLDEPTSGLDSQTSWSICVLMRRLVNHGQAILCTIHQPSAMLFQQFDRLLLLARGGKTVYFGEIGEQSKTLVDYFIENGAPSLPTGSNPAEWMLGVIGAAPGVKTDIDWPQVWLQSHEKGAVDGELDRLASTTILDTGKPEQAEEISEFAAPLSTQVVVVTQRIFQQYWRSPAYIYSKAFLGIGSVSGAYSFSLLLLTNTLDVLHRLCVLSVKPNTARNSKSALWYICPADHFHVICGTDNTLLCRCSFFIRNQRTTVEDLLMEGVYVCQHNGGNALELGKYPRPLKSIR